MSNFVGSARPTTITESRDWYRSVTDYDIDSGAFFVEMVGRPSAVWAPNWEQIPDYIGDIGADVGVMGSNRRAVVDFVDGASSKYGFVRVTRDQYGSALGGVSCFLFRVSDKLLIDSTVSDASGNYSLFTSYYPDAHMIVFQKSGSPDVQGVSVFTLIGT